MAVDRESVAVTLHIVEEHESLVQQFVSCGLPHGVGFVIVEMGKHIHLREALLYIVDARHGFHHVVDGGDAVEGVRSYILIV